MKDLADALGLVVKVYLFCFCVGLVFFVAGFVRIALDAFIDNVADVMRRRRCRRLREPDR